MYNNEHEYSKIQMNDIEIQQQYHCAVMYLPTMD